jgi:predicted secreted hydrolase
MPLLLAACTEQEPLPGAPLLRLSEVLGGDDTSGFLRADSHRQFAFPADHGPHAGFRNEWWYFTGNVQTPAGRRFGYQLTFFTAAQPPGPILPDSDWASDTLWMAHLALTDAAGNEHHAFERFSRANPGLAGAQAQPFHVWLDDWQVTQIDNNRWRLQAAEQGIALDLQLQSLKAPVLQGERGLSRKSDTPGNASYYYSMTRLQTRGTLSVSGESHTISGDSWLDREWSTSALDTGQSGWDWFSLQFKDNTELMLYQLRDIKDGVDRHSEGSWTLADGSQVRTTPAELGLEPLSWWTAPDGQRYATQWRLQRSGQSYRVEALLDDQFLPLALPYWEGAVRVVEEASGTETGWGYLEMVRQ